MDAEDVENVIDPLSDAKQCQHVEDANDVKDAALSQFLQLLEPGQAFSHVSDVTRAFVDEDFCRRILSSNGDVTKGIEKFKQGLLWCEENVNLLSSRKYRVSGDARVIGFGKGRQPVLYTCSKNQILSNQYTNEQYIVKMLEGMEMMPRGVGKMIHVMDCHGLALSMNWSASGPTRLMHVWDCVFADTMQMAFVIDLPGYAKFLTDAILASIPENLRSCIRFCTADEARLDIPRICDEETADRIIKVMNENRNTNTTLDQRRKTWMTVTATGDVVPVSRDGR